MPSIEEEPAVKNRQDHPQDNDLPAKLALPAQRALAGAGIRRLDQLALLSEDELKRLHGIGPKALDQLRDALAARGLSYAAGTGKKE